MTGVDENRALRRNGLAVDEVDVFFIHPLTQVKRLLINAFQKFLATDWRSLSLPVTSIRIGLLRLLCRPCKTLRQRGGAKSLGPTARIRVPPSTRRFFSHKSGFWQEAYETTFAKW